MGEGSYRLDGVTLWHSSFSLGLLKNPKVILDVGAYDFGDSIRFKQAFPECRVLGVEMSTDNYNKFHVFANNKGIETFNYAMCDINGLIEYYQATNVDGVNAQSSILEPGQVYKANYAHIVKHEKNQELATAKRLDTFCLENQILEVDLLHLDVEGAEYQVFAGFGKLRPKIIFAEFLFDGGWNGQQSFKETHDLLESYGYELKQQLSHDRIYKLKYS